MLETGDACRKRRSPKVLCANSEVQQSTRMRKRYAFAACAIRTETIFSLRLVCRWMLLYRGFSRSWLVGVGWSGLAGQGWLGALMFRRHQVGLVLWVLYPMYNCTWWQRRQRQSERGWVFLRHIHSAVEDSLSREDFLYDVVRLILRRCLRY